MVFTKETIYLKESRFLNPAKVHYAEILDIRKNHILVRYWNTQSELRIYFKQIVDYVMIDKMDYLKLPRYEEKI